jgi:hypothetical protein
MDARELDQLSYDLATCDVLKNHTFHPLGIDPIIQSCSAARARERRKAGAERRSAPHRDLANEHVRALRTTAETALPGQLGPLAHPIRVDRGPK